MFEAKEIYRIDGTAALKSQPVAKPAIIPFETLSQRKQACQNLEVVRGKHFREEAGSRRNAGFAKRARRVIRSSEMACSLMTESMSGCPFNVFTKQSIATLATSASLIAIVSLVIGA